MMRKYFRRTEEKAVLIAPRIQGELELTSAEGEAGVAKDPPRKLNNSAVLGNLDAKFAHLPSKEGQSLKTILSEYRDLFSDAPRCTNATVHDVELKEDNLIRQHPYRLSLRKLAVLKEEIDYMLDHGIIEPSQSKWASSCMLVDKPDGTVRFCTDYRKVNALTKADSYPIPIDKIGRAKYITKCDLLKGYWAVPLTERAKQISAFVTPEGTYQYRVMPFGMRNSQATFVRLMNACLAGIANVDTYIDDIVIYNDTWAEHVETIRKVFQRLRSARLTINLVKSEFCQAEVKYLGHVVGHGRITPLKAKTQEIETYPAPKNVRSLRRFLGMAGYYKEVLWGFCEHHRVPDGTIEKAQ